MDPKWDLQWTRKPGKDHLWRLWMLCILNSFSEFVKVSFSFNVSFDVSASKWLCLYLFWVFWGMGDASHGNSVWIFFFMAISLLPKFMVSYQSLWLCTLGTGRGRVVFDECDVKECLARRGHHRNDPVDLDRIIGISLLVKSHIDRSFLFNYYFLF